MRLLGPERLARHRILISQVAGVCLFVFAKPGSRPLFAAGFLLAVAGEAVRIWAAGTIKKNKQLASDGPYAVVRHPLYLGSFLILAGFCLCAANPELPFRTSALWLFALGSFAWMYHHKMADEEARLSELFGDDFERWRARTPRFLPTKAPSPRWRDGDFAMAQAVKNLEHHTVGGVMLASAFLWMRLIYRI